MSSQPTSIVNIDMKTKSHGDRARKNGESANMSEGKKRREEKRLSLLVTYLSSMVLQFGVQDETLTHDML